MMLRMFIPSVAVLLGWAAIPAAAEGLHYRIDPSFTSVAFSVDNLGGLFVTRGLFGTLQGDLLLDLDRPQNSRVDVSADTASVTTGWPASDDMLRSPDYLDPLRFPTIRYVTDHIERVAEDQVILRGTLTMRGVTLPQTFLARLENRRDQPGLGLVANFVIDGSVDRDQYGMTADHPLVGTTVAVRINAQVLLAPQAADVR